MNSHAGQLEDLGADRLDALAQLLAEYAEHRSVDAQSHVLHARERGDERQLAALVALEPALLGEPLAQHTREG